MRRSAQRTRKSELLAEGRGGGWSWWWAIATSLLALLLLALHAQMVHIVLNNHDVLAPEVPDKAGLLKTPSELRAATNRVPDAHTPAHTRAHPSEATMGTTEAAAAAAGGAAMGSLHFNESCAIDPDMRFWRAVSPRYHSPLYRRPGRGPRYVVYQPDLGGWNNIRMALEVSPCRNVTVSSLFVMSSCHRVTIFYSSCRCRDHAHTLTCTHALTPLLTQTHPPLSTLPTLPPQRSGGGGVRARDWSHTGSSPRQRHVPAAQQQQVG